jgi:hypothetical protein
MFETENASLKSQIETTERRIQQLESQLFRVDKYQDDSSINFYTGFANYALFLSVFKYLNPGDKGENINYWLSKSSNVRDRTPLNKLGRSRTLKPIDEYFLVMCRLRQGFPETHLGHLFQLSQPTVSRIFITWIHFVYLKLGQINIWPSRVIVDQTMPEDFKKEYKSTRVIIDCTEVRCEIPSSLHLNGQLFSSYKNHTTMKGLIGISPGGAITVISQLYTGNISDREIVVRCGMLDLPFSQNDTWLIKDF